MPYSGTLYKYKVYIRYRMCRTHISDWSHSCNCHWLFCSWYCPVLTDQRCFWSYSRVAPIPQLRTFADNWIGFLRIGCPDCCPSYSCIYGAHVLLMPETSVGRTTKRSYAVSWSRYVYVRTWRLTDWKRALARCMNVKTGSTLCSHYHYTLLIPLAALKSCCPEMLSAVCSVLSQEIGWVELLQNDLFCVK